MHYRVAFKRTDKGPEEVIYVDAPEPDNLTAIFRAGAKANLNQAEISTVIMTGVAEAR